MTATLNGRPTATSPAHQPLLETVDPHANPMQIGALSDNPADDIDAAAHLEQDFLAALLWAPPAEAGHVIDCLAGLDDAVLFFTPTNHTIYRTAADLRASGTPANIRTVGAALTLNPNARRAMLDVAAPTGGISPSWPELKQLATALVDAWYRRGYFDPSRGFRRAHLLSASSGVRVRSRS